MGIPKNKSTEIVEILLEIIKSTQTSGEDVLNSDFGKLCVIYKDERKGRNPATGDAMILAPRKVVTFQEEILPVEPVEITRVAIDQDIHVNITINNRAGGNAPIIAQEIAKRL